MRPKVLVASALLWPNAARLCRAFRDVGFDVGAIAVAENPVHIAKTPSRAFLYSPAAPLDSLREAIKHHGPDLIIPCDERILGHLQTVKATDNRLTALVERSLGPGGASGEVARRGSLREIGRLPDVVVPRTDTVESLADLRKWARIHGLPAALKLDGSSGGVDVVIVRCESELRRAFLEMMVRRSPLKGLKRYVIDRDVEALRFGPKRDISVQSYVAGRPANVAVACWRGEVIAHVAVEVLQTSGPLGVATVVRVVDGDAMVAEARSICRKFDLSGLHGFDFVIDQDSGIAKLIEINARATQTGHFPLGPGRDLAAAFFTVFSGGRDGVGRPSMKPGDIALFPQEWLRDPQSSYLTSAFHDVPAADPELARFYGFEHLGPRAVAAEPELLETVA